MGFINLSYSQLPQAHAKTRRKPSLWNPQIAQIAADLMGDLTADS